MGSYPTKVHCVQTEQHVSVARAHIEAMHFVCEHSYSVYFGSTKLPVRTNRLRANAQLTSNMERARRPPNLMPLQSHTGMPSA